MPIYSAGADGGNRLGRSGPSHIPGLVTIETQNFVCLAVGWRHNIVIYQDGSAMCWGDNTEFQLGYPMLVEIPRPRKLELFKDDSLRWAHCGDKITTFLTRSGKAFVCGLPTNKRVLELQIPLPCIFVSSGVNFSVAIDIEGSIYRANSGNTSTQKWNLPSPVCDAACGKDFILALTTKGQVYCLGHFGMEGKGSNVVFMPVPSLVNIHIARVFAYNDHASVITRDGRVMMCGNGSHGMLGFGDNQGRSRFEFLTDLDRANIIEIDMGDNHTMFLSIDGDIYGCGESKDGRLMCAENNDLSVPTKSMQISGKAVFVRCGCQHTIVVTDTSRTVHPGLAHFNLIGNLVSIPRIMLFDSEPINIAASSLTSHNLIPGDTIISEGYGPGFTVGVLSANVVCYFKGCLREVPYDSVKFVSRKGFRGISGVTANKENVVFDGGAICSLFGFNGGDVVFDTKGREFYVLGFAFGTVWFSLNGIAYCMKDDSLYNLHRVFRYGVGSLGITYKDTPLGTYPIVTKEPFYARCGMNICHITGEFGNFNYGITVCGSPSLFPKQKCRKLQKNNMFYELDRIRFPSGEFGFVLSCQNDKIGVVTDDDIINGANQMKLIQYNDICLISSFSNQRKRILNETEYEISLFCFQDKHVFPGDMFLCQQRYCWIIGINNGIVYAIDQNENIFPFKLEDSILILRYFDIGEFRITCKSEIDEIPNVSVSLSSFFGTGFLPADEIKFQGITYVVRGAIDSYFLLQNINTREFSCVAMNTPLLKASLELVSRPTNNTQIFC